jgi:hypothetical protein
LISWKRTSIKRGESNFFMEVWFFLNVHVNRYFHLNSTDQRPNKVQVGSVRTNCMDNLDRTNVVQASLAKWTLNQQLHAVGILPATETIDDYEALSSDFRESKEKNIVTSSGYLTCPPFFPSFFFNSVGRSCR